MRVRFDELTISAAQAINRDSSLSWYSKGPGGFGRIVSSIMNLIMPYCPAYVLFTVQNIPG